jgi:hypothetical protein
MKKVVYIVCFTFLGLLVSTLVHAFVELPLLWLITSDIGRYGDTFLWRNWEVLHGTFAVTTWFVGLVGGAWAGHRYWHLLYEEQR